MVPQVRYLTKGQGVAGRKKFKLYVPGIVQDPPTAPELKEWQRRSDLPLKRFFNTSGMNYRSLGLKDKLPEMSEAEALKLLASGVALL